jgi:hypothetical protein
MKILASLTQPQHLRLSPQACPQRADNLGSCRHGGSSHNSRSDLLLLLNGPPGSVSTTPDLGLLIRLFARVVTNQRARYL